MTITHDDFEALALADPEVKAEYDALEDEFALYNEMLRARKSAGLSQAEVATRMHSTQSVVARLETAGGNKKHSPSINTLRKYAEAVGCHLEIKFKPNHS